MQIITAVRHSVVLSHFRYRGTEKERAPLHKKIQWPDDSILHPVTSSRLADFTKSPPATGQRTQDFQNMLQQTESNGNRRLTKPNSLQMTSLITPGSTTPWITLEVYLEIPCLPRDSTHNNVNWNFYGAPVITGASCSDTKTLQTVQHNYLNFVFSPITVQSTQMRVILCMNVTRKPTPSRIWREIFQYSLYIRNS